MRSRMMRKCHVRFWRRVSEVTHWLSLMRLINNDSLSLAFGHATRTTC
ncbi:MAG: hypothetical protein F6J98_20440 [Moorea sp. SIO4G2]|nr:hypothetical protein [Moorena sp. SIO4G2]